MEHTNFCKSLRNNNINYKNGYFFITIQVNQNKSIFGAMNMSCGMPLKFG